MIPLYRRIPNPKNPQYPHRPDGSLQCGPGCFSKANVLKARFASSAEAKEFLDSTSRTAGHELYECEYCDGVHVTTKVELRKRKK